MKTFTRTMELETARIPNRFMILFLCALFNLLFEYSARGIRDFVHRPFFMLILFGIYFTYFAMLEDLIVRFRLKNYQIFLGAFVYGLFPLAFLTGNVFNPHVYSGIMIAGVNIGTIIIVGIFSWGCVQGIVTLYFANRFSPRDWTHPKMGKLGWTLAVLYQLSVMIVARQNPVTPRGTPLGYFVLGILVIFTFILFLKSLKTPIGEVTLFQQSTVMDILAFGSVILFIFNGTVLISGPTVVTSQPLNLLPATIENIWVIICAVTFFVYRFYKGSDVVV
jgi:hypothetical protein